MKERQKIDSLCVYCGSSNAVSAEKIAQAETLGRLLAEAEIRMVYGGGGVGLMGACAKAAHEAGGQVLGIIPEFLRSAERLYDEVETRVVTSMHERKWLLFSESEAFVALPGGIGTLEEVVELMSWRKLALHAKPLVFFNPDGFWDPFFVMMDRMVEQNLLPADFRTTWRAVDQVEDIIPAAYAQLAVDEAAVAEVI